jgi:hypothetical protein
LVDELHGVTSGQTSVINAENDLWDISFFVGMHTIASTLSKRSEVK